MTASCHDAGGAARPSAATLERAPRIVLLGNPNAGKSTLFNSLTRSRQHVTNAPGTTVELCEGTWLLGGRRLTLVDLPGTYSLLARAADEKVTALALRTGAETPGPDVVVATLEAGALARALYLLGQVLADPQAPRVVVALTMTDVARDRGVVIDAHRLGRVLGLPVVVVDPRDRRTLGALEAAVAGEISAAARRSGSRVAGPSHAGPSESSPEAVFDWVSDVLAELEPAPAARTTVSDRVDQVLLNPWFGIPVFLAVMWAVFQLATTAAGPVMGLVESAFTALGEWVITWLPGPGWIGSLLVDGVLAGVGVLASFVPLLALVFGAIALLEDSGYLARAAFVADRAMSALGLDGRALLPLVVGFGCNVPALTATRTLPDARSRLLVGLLIPLTACPARLTVLLFIATSVFPGQAGTAVFGMYVLSIVMVVLGGLALRRTLFRDLRREGLVLALPAYQRPRAGMLLRAVGSRSASFVRKAGVVIVGTLTVVWVLLAVPVTGNHTIGDVPVADSAYGAAAHAAAPVFAPAGFGDWHFSAALATGFVAKEVVVGSFAQTYALEEPDDPSQASDLSVQINDTLERTSGGHTTAAALAFLVFVMVYTPCLATVGEQRRLYGARWTLGALGVQLAGAWLLAVAVFQVGRAVGSW